MNTQFLPLAIVAIMLSLGMSLTVQDFRRAARLPGPLSAALFCQILLLPAVGIALAHSFDLPPSLAVGLMLTAACPGGALANMFSHLAGGDLALNLTLTAVNAVLSIVALPVILLISMNHFLGSAEMIPLQYTKLVQVFAVVLVPTAIGMFVRHQWPAFAAKVMRTAKAITALILLVAVVQSVNSGWGTLSQHWRQLGPAVVLFNWISLTVGYLVPRMMRLAPRQAIAISLEIGLHNVALAMSIAMSPQLLNSTEMAVPAVVYGMSAVVVATVFVACVRWLDPAMRRGAVTARATRAGAAGGGFDGSCGPPPLRD